MPDPEQAIAEVEGDPYLLGMLLTLRSRADVERFVFALKQVIARHDVLRTAVLWDGLKEPVQVICREAALLVEDLQLDPHAGDVARIRDRDGRPLRTGAGVVDV